MNTLSLLSTFLVTSLSLFVLKPLANRYGLIDEPGGRKTHAAPTPLIGGLGIYLGTLTIIFFSQDLLSHYAPLLAISALVLFVGMLDDLKEISVSSRMGVQAGSALLMCLVADNQLASMGNLLGFGDLQLGVFAIPVTIFATVGVINAINMSDGLDGLSGGMVTISLGFLGLMAWFADNLLLATFISTLIFSLLGFLALNNRLPWKRPALIYLGDAGSTFLGFVVAWLLIESTQGAERTLPPALALWFVAVPLIDTVYLLVSRPLQGRSPFAPGRDHLHHKLLNLGLSTGSTVTVLYCTAIVIGLCGVAAYELGASESLLFYGFLGLFACYALFSRQQARTIGK